MWKPGRRFCDFCEQPIVDDNYPMLMLPLTPEQLQTIATAANNLVQETAEGQTVVKIFGNVSPMMLPTHYRFEFCNGCVDGFLPMMEKLRQQAVATIIRRMQRRSEKLNSGQTKTQIAEDEADD
jgi:hypothetical protein